MPRVSDSGGASFHIPGVYEKLLGGRCRCGFHCRSDPRLGLQGLTAEQRALFEWLTAQCAWEAQQDRAERLAVGEPFEVPRWYFGGRSIPRQDGWPPWLRDHFGGVRSVRLHADDTIEPVDVD